MNQKFNLLVFYTIIFMQICDFLVSIAVVFERRFIALTHFTLYTQSAYQSVMSAVVENILERCASLLAV